MESYLVSSEDSLHQMDLLCFFSVKNSTIFSVISHLCCTKVRIESVKNRRGKTSYHSQVMTFPDFWQECLAQRGSDPVSDNSLRICLYVLRKGFPPYNPILPMGLRPSNPSILREGSKIIGVYSFMYAATKSHCKLVYKSPKHGVV